jgi:CDGSH-type Zn-finger protein
MKKGELAGSEPIGIEVEAGKSYWWCACGRSSNQPFCDGSHAGSEFEPLEHKAEKNETVWFCACKQTSNRPLCDGSHSALAEAEKPAGIENTVEIAQRENGPLVVKQLEKFYDPDGNAMETRSVMALCRCGHSKNKPFCDGSHKEVGFSSTNQREDRKGRMHTYEGNGITVAFNPLVCSHAAECARLNQEVFDSNERPWIRPANGDEISIGTVMSACPSGALSWSPDGKNLRHEVGDKTEIRVEKNGPYWVRNIAIDDVEWAEGASQSKYVLCRCGLSKNKPFCDGTHRDERWRDDE